MARYAGNYTHKDLHDKLNKIVNDNWEEIRHYGDIIGYMRPARTFIRGTQKLYEDLDKYMLEESNANHLGHIDTPQNIIDHLVGDITINGVAYIGFTLQLRTSKPYYAVMYLDNKKALRGYIPKQGNAINPIDEFVFGDPFNERYRRVGSTNDMYDNEYLRNNGVYTDYFKLNHDDPAIQKLFYDMDKIKKDISKRIVLKNG